MAYTRPNIVSGTTRADKPFFDNILDGVDEKLSKSAADLAYAPAAQGALTEALAVSSAGVGVGYGPPIVVTQIAGNTTGIAGGVLVPSSDAAFRYIGLNASKGDTGTHLFFKALPAATSGTASNPWRAEFDYNGQAFEIRAFRPSSPVGSFRLWVDGRVDSDAMTPLANSGNNVVRIAFPDAKLRRIAIEFDSGFNFGGVWRESSAAVTPSTIPAGTKHLAVLGDSLVWGAGIAASGQQALGFPQLLGRLLGWNISNLGIGGTGWVNDASVTATHYSDRFPNLYSVAPDVVLIPGSQNDKNAAAGTIQTAAAAGLAAIRAQLPNAKVVATGVLFPARPSTARGGMTESRVAAMNTEIRAAATSVAGVSYIDVATWFTGTGRIGTPDGGNADWYRTSLDWAHPSADGHAYIARRFAAELKRLVA